MNKIIEAYPKAGKTVYTAPVWQYDYGHQLHINGLELPASYKAEFSNASRGDAIATVQTTDTVVIPAQCLESGNLVYIWLVVVDERSRTTEYSLIIPVSPRAKPIDLEPSPEEQSEIEQTLSALSGAVSNVQEIAEAIPDTINAALEAAKTSGEFDGADGKDGQDGKDGADGFSPTAAVNKAGDTSTITITDKNGTTTATVKDGKDGSPGADGISPSITVTDITGGHRVTITDADGQHSFDVMDGEDGQGLPAGGTAGQVLEKTSGADYAVSWADKNPVVQVSGTTPSITALAGIQYVCDEVATLDITLPASGCVDVVFQSGSTPTVLTITPPTGVTLKWANGFDPTSLEANTIYEINIMDGCLGVAGSWT